MANTQPHRLKTISAYHQLMGLPRPEHPLVSVVRFESIQHLPGSEPISLVNDYYSIALKRNFNGETLSQKGLPTVQFIAGSLNVSPNYLSVLLKRSCEAGPNRGQ